MDGYDEFLAQPLVRLGIGQLVLELLASGLRVKLGNGVEQQNIARIGLCLASSNAAKLSAQAKFC